MAELIPAPVLLPQNNASVSSTFTVTNTPDDPAWRTNITSISVNGSLLPPAAYSLTTAGKIVFDPSQSALLQTSGSKTLAFSAPGYSTNTVAQPLVAGAATQLVITKQPTAPGSNGGSLAQQPVVVVKDQLGNTVTNNVSITATPVLPLPVTWTLGGNKAITTSGGTATFTNLTASSPTAITGAAIAFTSGSLSVTSSPAFNISAPVLPTIGGSVPGPGMFAVSFTNVTGLSFSILATNDITAPVSTWPVVGTAVESPAGSGNYWYTNSSATNGVQYYILRQP
jgi:hypothetical protein